MKEKVDLISTSVFAQPVTNANSLEKILTCPTSANHAIKNEEKKGIAEHTILNLSQINKTNNNNKDKCSRDSGFISSSMSEIGVSSMVNSGGESESGSSCSITGSSDVKELLKYEHNLAQSENKVIIYLFNKKYY